MKETIYRLTVALFGLALFLLVVSVYYPIKAILPVPFDAEIDISLPYAVALLVGLVALVAYRPRFHEPFVKPYKGADPNFKVLAFNPHPLFCLYFALFAVLEATKASPAFALLYWAFAFYFFLRCHRHGFRIVQSWYETPEGKLLRIARW